MVSYGQRGDKLGWKLDIHEKQRNRVRGRSQDTSQNKEDKIVEFINGRKGDEGRQLAVVLLRSVCVSVPVTVDYDYMSICFSPTKPNPPNSVHGHQLHPYPTNQIHLPITSVYHMLTCLFVPPTLLNLEPFVKQMQIENETQKNYSTRHKICLFFSSFPNPKLKIYTNLKIDQITTKNLPSQTDFRRNIAEMYESIVMFECVYERIYHFGHEFLCIIMFKV
jgi:hypothetical protein